MLETLQIINLIITVTAGGFALLVTLSKPLRRKILGNKREKEQEEKERADRQETDACLLRDRILSIYYKHYKDCEIRQYEFENAEHLYKQYRKLGGNAFVEKIWDEMQEWKIL